MGFMCSCVWWSRCLGARLLNGPDKNYRISLRGTQTPAVLWIPSNCQGSAAVWHCRSCECFLVGLGVWQSVGMVESWLVGESASARRSLPARLMCRACCFIFWVSQCECKNKWVTTIAEIMHSLREVRHGELQMNFLSLNICLWEGLLQDQQTLPAVLRFLMLTQGEGNEKKHWTIL